MPLTSFRFGPGALVKAAVLRTFSLRLFILSQVIMDCETAWNIFRGNQRLHTYFHSYIGSIGPMLVTIGLALVFNKYRTFVPFLSKTGDPWVRSFSRFEILVSAAIGVWSHVFLDSIMHRDLTPFWPISEINPTLSLISVTNLHLICLISFPIAGIIFLIRKLGSAK